MPHGLPVEYARIIRANDQEREQVEREVRAAIQSRREASEPHAEEASAQTPASVPVAQAEEPGVEVSGRSAADPTPADVAQMWLSPDPIPLPMGERRADDQDIFRVDLEDDIEMLNPPTYQQVARVETHETQAGELVCSWDSGDVKD